MNELIYQWSNKIGTEIIEMRRHFHKYPELGYQEYETAEYIKKKLLKYGIPFQSGIAKTGILGIIEGKYKGRVVALRADMDALPIQEENTHSFVSTKENIMHACGHDAHMAILLGTGFILQQLRDYIYGTVLLVFQPAEEMGPIGGAKPMLDDGVFKDYKPDVIYGQHVWPQLPVGQIGIRDKEMMGASDTFKITLKGKGGHASMPHLTNDPIVTAAYLITNLQSIVSRNLNPLEASVITIGKIEGREAKNIISNKVYLEGSIRTYDANIKKNLKKRFFEITNHVAEMYNNEVVIEYLDGYSATINTPKWARLVRETAQSLFGKEATPDVQPSLAAEDFSRFLEEIPGAFFWLGTRLEDTEKQKGLHDSMFQINEEALIKGSALLTKLAINTLNELKKGEK
ncbi:M20 family metallopeptidase [Pallidibacillus thermolactis]|uniref:M20 metallopeptidase family protein n=1 Tax=Pallidibacillus thermolactis TaxID=251051 RepID=UPI002E1BECB7|nr:M20 family metallopeptidase [Pallidibacillus thermolactis subsp. kokeshiiformis]